MIDWLIYTSLLRVGWGEGEKKRKKKKKVRETRKILHRLYIYIYYIILYYIILYLYTWPLQWRTNDNYTHFSRLFRSPLISTAKGRGEGRGGGTSSQYIIIPFIVLSFFFFILFFFFLIFNNFHALVHIISAYIYISRSCKWPSRERDREKEREWKSGRERERASERKR